jgi:hypothetical protein
MSHNGVPVDSYITPPPPMLLSLVFLEDWWKGRRKMLA